MKKIITITFITILLLAVIGAVVFVYNRDSLNEFLWEEYCKDGKNEHCFNLGLINEGRRDFEKAKEFYKLACDGRDADACYNYGFFFMEGIGGEANMKIAGKYYKKACEGGKARACHYLSVIYANGTGGVGKDIEKAVFYAEEVCKFNKKMCVVGPMYLINGQLNEAEQYFIKNPKSLNMGKVKLLKGETEEAFKIYGEFLKDNSYENVKSIKKGLKELAEVYPDKEKNVKDFEKSLEKLLKYDFEKDFNLYKRLCFEESVYYSCYSLTWYAILVKKLDVAEKAFKKEQKERANSSIEFNIGHWYLLKDLSDDALSNYIVGLKKMTKKKEEKIDTIKEDFKLLTEVYPEKTEEFKEMEETLISFVKSSEKMDKN